MEMFSLIWYCFKWVIYWPNNNVHAKRVAALETTKHPPEKKWKIFHAVTHRLGSVQKLNLTTSVLLWD